MLADGDDTASIAQRRQELADRVPAWIERTLDQHLDWCAQVWPDERFLIEGDHIYTYADLDRWSRQLAVSLRDRGVVFGEQVGLLMGNSAEFFALTFALSRLGAVAVPLNYFLAPRELEQVLRSSRCAVVVAESMLPTGSGVEHLRASLGGWTSRVGTGELPDLRSVYLTAPATLDRPLSFEVLGPATEEWGESGNSSPGDTSHLFFTSGSTGVPKGVPERHDSLLREAFGTAHARAYDDGWTVLMPLPPFHIFGLLQSVLAPSFVGGAVVIERSFDPERSLELIGRHRVDDLVAVPAMSQRLVDVARGGSHDLSTFRALLSAGNAVPAEHWAEIVDVLGVRELGTGYGMTEAPGIITLVGPDDPAEMLTGTVGLPKNSGVAGIVELGGSKHSFKIVDLESGREVPRGSDGEILIGGPTLMSAYWCLPEESAEAFDADYLRTGDVGHFRADGALVLTGRVKDLYRSGGENVSPKEVEAALQEHPAVRQAVVVGVPDQRWGESGAAWIVLADDRAATPEELRQHCRENLARYKVPRDVLLVAESELPLTGVGKLDRRELARRASARAEPRA